MDRAAFVCRQYIGLTPHPDSLRVFYIGGGRRGGWRGWKEGGSEGDVAGGIQGGKRCLLFLPAEKKKEKRFFVRLLLVPFFSGGKFESIYSK